MATRIPALLLLLLPALAAAQGQPQPPQPPPAAKKPPKLDPASLCGRAESILADPAGFEPSARPAYLSERYFRELAGRISERDVRECPQLCLEEVFGLVKEAAAYSRRAEPLPELERLFREMEKRGRIPGLHSEELIDRYVALRMFEKAAALAARRPPQRPLRVPALVLPAPVLAKGGARVLSFSVDGKTLTLENVSLAGVRFVLVARPNCEFTRAALKTVAADARLRKAFDGRLLLLLPPDEELFLEESARWNRARPDTPLHHVYRAADWPQVDEWASSFLYVLSDGKLVLKLDGWAPGRDVAKLKKMLAPLGL
ncbi:MAG: hypothetical protein WC969_09625 [Elusimicrobiota bacterium]|jgi:hypothetical protein